MLVRMAPPVTPAIFSMPTMAVSRLNRVVAALASLRAAKFLSR